MKYSRKRAVAQITATSLKAAKLAIGTELTLEEVRMAELQGRGGEETPNDTLICNSRNGRVSIPVREFTKMKTTDDTPLWTGEDNSTNVELPEKFVIRSSEDRKDRNGNVIFPIFAYKDADKQLAENNIDWNALVASGLKDNHGYDPVQNYTIEVM